MRDPTQEDWGDSITRVIGEVIIDGGLTTWDVHIRGASTKGRPGDDSSGDRLRMTLPLVFEAPGQPARTLMQIAEEAHRADPSQGHYVEDFPDGTVARTPADPQHLLDGRAVASVSFMTRSNPPTRLQIDVNSEGSIRMIMRNLSEDRHHRITADGEIIETR